MKEIIEEYGECIVGAVGATAVFALFLKMIHASGFIYDFIMQYVNCAC